MADPLLVIMTVVLSLLLLVINFYLLVYYQHPDDKNVAYFPKVLVVFGLLFVEACVLLLPLDVANKSGSIACNAWQADGIYSVAFCGGLNMTLLWQIVYMSIAVFIVVLIPFAILYYEADDGMDNVGNSQFCSALKFEVVLLVVIVGLSAILFALANTTQLPLTEMVAKPSEAVNLTAAVAAANGSISDVMASLTVASGDVCACEASAITLDFNVTYPIYLTALLSFIGWWFFVLFGGIGMIALPMDLLNAFAHRPKIMPPSKYAEAQLELVRRAKQLSEIGAQIKAAQLKSKEEKMTRKQRRKQKDVDRLTLNKFKQAVFVLERDLEDLQICGPEFNNHNPLVPWIKLFAGIVSIILSILWVLQICLYMVPPVPLTGFLNDYFIALDSFFPLFGTLSVGLFTLYLLAIVIKGNFKFGLRFFCFEVHPMVYGGTLMNSFLFNLALIMLCAMPVVQFATQAFSKYARLTDVDVIFGTQIRYLQFYSLFFANNIFVFVFLGLTFISMVYFICRPADLPPKASELKAALRAGSDE
eukprot:PLAT11677.1.p1 GENE.PLAT11677.1~~PLAT11677.1.p1  ORF type:complete len:560 (+),score=308.21 PLAT11677.1:87-1682(+)